MLTGESQRQINNLSLQNRPHQVEISVLKGSSSRFKSQNDGLQEVKTLKDLDEIDGNEDMVIQQSFNLKNPTIEDTISVDHTIFLDNDKKDDVSNKMSKPMTLDIKAASAFKGLNHTDI